jgi:MHS family proline/betaine transporter-like MFS transporter
MFTKKEKEVVTILSLGTFIEYFDFYLYFHFAVTLNNLFYAPQDGVSALLLTSFGYCVSYIFRPIASILFGYIGDLYGRKVVINITFLLMGTSCIGIFYLPTYNDIGVWASIMITFYRVLQGMSSMGEIVGGEIYLTEYLQGKKVFIGNAILILCCSIACLAALYGIQMSIKGAIDFRYLFLGGMVIFVLGFFARRNLVESSEFLKAKTNRGIKNDQISLKTYVACFFVESVQPLMLFISVFGINNLLKTEYNFSDADIVTRNMTTTCFHILYVVLAIILFLRFNPYFIAVIRLFLGVLMILLSPFLLSSGVENILIVQSLISLLFISDVSVLALKHKCIPISKRFRVGVISFAFVRAIIAIVTSLSLIFLMPYLGDYFILVMGLPFAIGFYFGIRHFKKLDQNLTDGLLRHYE